MKTMPHLKYIGILFATTFFILMACTNQTTKKGDYKVYDIKEIDELSAQIVNAPGDALLYAKRAMLFGEYEFYQEAELDAEKALSLDSMSVDLYRILGNAYFDNNHSHAAVTLLEKAIERFPEEKSIYFILAEMQMILQQHQQSLVIIDKLMKLHPNHPEGLFIQGQILKEMGDTLKAMDRYQATVEQDADFIDAYIQLAILSGELGSALTMRYIDNALRIDSMSQTALLLKAQYHHFRSDYAQAQLEYEKAILKHPQSANFNYNLALMYMELGENADKNNDKALATEQYKLAFHHFDNATKFDLQFADAYFYKGMSAERMGNKEVAKTDYENAMRLQAFLGTVSPEVVEDCLVRLNK
jgi:tetratricopeptide (TPR) repeat protein